VTDAPASEKAEPGAGPAAAGAVERWLARLPATPAAAARWAAVFVLGLSAYANAALLFGPEAQRFFPPFRAGIPTNFNGHLGAEYFYIAIALARGEGFSNPFGAATGPTAWMPPLYPLLLAGLLRLGGGSHAFVAAAVVLLQNATWIATAALVFALARDSARRLRPAAALAFPGLWLLAHFYWFFQHTHDVWIAMLALDGVLWCGARVLRADAQQPWRVALGFGAAGGAALLTSPILGFAFAAGALWLLRQRPALRAPLAAALALAALVGGLWTARNYAVFGELVLAKSNLAYDAYQASFESPSGVYDEPFFRAHPVWSTARDPESLYRREGELAFAAHYRAKLAAALRERPAEFARKALQRLVAATLVHRPYRPALEGAHPLLGTLLLPLPLVGIAAALGLARGPRPPLLGFALCLYASALAPYALLAFYLRYLLPLTPLLALFVFWGADALATARRSGGPPASGGSAAPAR